MKTNVTHSSLQSYDELKASCKAAKKKRNILDVMLPGVVYSRRQLSVLTKLETSCVAGRCNELIADGVLEVVGYIDCPITHRKVEALTLTPVQLELAA